MGKIKLRLLLCAPHRQYASNWHSSGRQDVFNEFGVQIMSPHFVAQPDKPVVVPKAMWHEAPAEPEDATAHAAQLHERAPQG